MARVQEDYFIKASIELMAVEERINAEGKKLKDAEVRLSPHMGLIRKWQEIRTTMERLSNSRKEIKSRMDRLLKVITIKREQNTPKRIGGTPGGTVATPLLSTPATSTPSTSTPSTSGSTSKSHEDELSFNEAFQELCDDELIAASQDIEQKMKPAKRQNETEMSCVPAKRILLDEILLSNGNKDEKRGEVEKMLPQPEMNEQMLPQRETNKEGETEEPEENKKPEKETEEDDTN